MYGKNNSGERNKLKFCTKIYLSFISNEYIKIVRDQITVENL